MKTVSIETLAKIAELAVSCTSRERYEKQAFEVLGDHQLALRTINWLQESFGLVLIAHLDADLIPPTTFAAQDTAGEWIEFPFAADPIFKDAFGLATTVFHNDPRDVFSSLAKASSIFSVVNKALNQGVSLQGAELLTIHMYGVSAETYGVT